ncbi:MAG TPA: hypothetical protein VIK27_08900 [Candidatus Aquilonibacter sp.]
MMVRRPARIAVALLAVVVGAVPLGALAQPEPAGMPSYAVPASADAKADDQETIHGSVASVDDADTLQVNDDRGFVDNVKLEPGTLINPSGSRLQPGMVVTIAGVNRGAVFAARRIDIATASKSSTSPAAPQAQVIPPGQPAPGTELTGNLKTSLDSKSAVVGEAVVLTDVSSPDGSIRGATLAGTVTDVTPAGQGRAAQVKLHFDSLHETDGKSYPIDGSVASMQVKTKSNALKEAGGALVGMLAGNALAKTILGIGGGGILGAVGGYLIAKDNRADVVIPADTAITVQLVNARRQAL